MRVDKIISLLFLLAISNIALAQDDLFSDLDEIQEEIPQYETSFFKATRVINSPSIELTAPGAMNFMIQHRFGTLSDGVYDLFGIDNSEVRLAFDFGLTDWWMVGVARSGFQKTYDFNTKIRLLRQQNGAKKVPVSLAFYHATAFNTIERNPELDNKFRLSYVSELIVARKLSKSTTLQVSPGWIHANLVRTNAEDNAFFFVGLAARQKVSNRVAINLDYIYRSGSVAENSFNALALGVDIETGGHVFQLHITNSRGMFDKAYIMDTQGDLSNGDIYFGFNINRDFRLKKKQKEEGEEL